MVDPVDIDVEKDENLFDKMEEAMINDFLKNRFPAQLSHDFCCLRLHWTHAWGMMHHAYPVDAHSIYPYIQGAGQFRPLEINHGLRPH